MLIHVHYVHYVHVHKVKAQKFLPPYPPPYRDRGSISLSSGKPVVDSLGVWPSKFDSRWTIQVRARHFLRFLIAYSSRPQSRKKRLKITVFRQRRREKRSCGRCDHRIDLNRKIGVLVRVRSRPSYTGWGPRMRAHKLDHYLKMLFPAQNDNKLIVSIHPTTMRHCIAPWAPYYIPRIA